MDEFNDYSEKRLFNALTLDIETVPMGTRNMDMLKSTEELLPGAPKSYSKAKQLEWAEKKSQDLVIAMEKEYRDRSFSAMKGRIVCISIKWNDGPSYVIPYNEDEKVILNALVSRLKNLNRHIYTCVIIGNRIFDFDIRFIIQKAFKFGIKDLLRLLPTQKNDKRIYDLGVKFNLDIYGQYTSLKDMCAFLNVPTPKDDIDGSQVLDAFERGEIDRIEIYCGKDTDAEYECYLKMLP